MKQWYKIGKQVPWILIAFVLIWMPFFFSAVFFRQGHIEVDIVMITLTTIGALYYGVMQLIRHNRGKVDPDEVQHPSATDTNRLNAQSNAAYKTITMYDYAFFLYIVFYIIAIFHSASVTRAVIGALDALAMLFPYLLFRFAAGRLRASHWIVAGIAISSVVVNVVGMGSAWGFIDYPSAFANGIVSSVFQYHNSYASFETAVSLAIITFLALGGAKNALVKSLYAGVSSLALLGLLISASRGALLFFAIILALMIIGMFTHVNGQVTQQIFGARFLSYLYLDAVSVGLGYHELHKGILTSDSKAGWIGIGITVLFPFLMSLIISILFRKNDIIDRWKKWLNFQSLLIGGLLLTISAIIIKRHSLLTKLHSYHIHQTSVVQRFIFWQDGLKIVSKNPLFGSGGGAWPTMFQMVQRYPYWSTRVHSFVVQTAMEVGILGLIALVIALWPMIRSAVWPYQEYELDPTARALSILGLALFAHAMMDWDMSFSYLRILLTIGMGSAAGIAALHNSSMKKKLSRIHEFLRKNIWYSRTTAIVTMAFGIALLYPIITGFKMNEAINLSNEANNMPLSITRVQLLQKAESLAPFEGEYPSQLGDTFANIVSTLKLTGSQAQREYQSALQQQLLAAKLDPYNPTYQQNVATLAYQLGDMADAYKHATLAFQDAPFHASNAEMAIDAGTAYAMIVAHSNPALSRTVFLNIQSTYAQYVRREQIVRHLPSYLPPSSLYQLHDFTYDSLAATALALHQPNQALHFASLALPSNTPHTHQLAKLITLLAEQTLGQPVTSQQIHAYVTEHPSVKTSYALLLNVV